MHWRARAGMGVLSMGLGALASPAKCFQAPPTLLAAQAEQFQPLSDQAEQARKAGDSDTAIRLYFKALDIRPSWAEGWRKVGMLLADRKEFPRAEQAFRKLTSLEPKDGTGWALLGLCEYEQGRLEAAYPHLERARSLHITNPDLDRVATFNTALILIQRGEFPMAQSLLKRVARLGSEDPDLVTAFGLDALRLPTTPEKLDPALAPLVTRVGRIEFEDVGGGTPGERTNGAFEELLKERPDDSSLHYAYGDFLLSSARYDQGIEEMKKTLALDPRDVMAMLQLALTYTKMGEADQGLPFAEKAVEQAPKLFASHYALGWTLYRLGKSNRAITELEAAVKLGPQDARAHYALSEAYMQAHRKNDAMREREIFARLKQQEEPEAPSQAPPAPQR